MAYQKSDQNLRRIGAVYENLAADYLKRQGYKILEQNYRIRQSEIDIIALQGEVLVFVEVKYRKNGACGAPAEAVNLAKQRRISRAAAQYLAAHGIWERISCRFDVIEILGNQIRHIEDAFPYNWR